MDMQISSQTAAGDNLLAGPNQVTDTVTLLSGEGSCLRGQLLGKITKSAGAPAAGANAGNGTITAVSLGSKAKLGTYAIKCVAAAANGGTFKVVDPEGYALDAQAAVGTPFVSGHLNFTINDGAADFIVGDSFAVAVGAGSGKYRKHNAASVDGSQEPSALLAQDADAATADKPAPAYLAGQFNSSAVTGYSSGLKDALRARGIFVKTIG